MGIYSGVFAIPPCFLTTRFRVYSRVDELRILGFSMAISLILVKCSMGGLSRSLDLLFPHAHMAMTFVMHGGRWMRLLSWLPLPVAPVGC